MLTWAVIGFVIVEHNLSSSVHHTRIGRTRNRWAVAVEGTPGPPNEFDTDELFEATVRSLLDGIESTLRRSTQAR